MKKNDYIATLRSHLASFSELDRQEILSDIDEHFSNGISNGKTEDEISSALGDPAVIAKQYGQTGSDNNSTANDNVNSGTATFVNTNNSGKPRIANIIIVIILNMFILSSIVPVVISVIFGFWAATISMLISGIFVFFASLITLTIEPAGIFIGIGLTSLGLLACIGMFYGTRLVVKGTKIYIRWNIRFVKGDA